MPRFSSPPSNTSSSSAPTWTVVLRALHEHLRRALQRAPARTASHRVWYRVEPRTLGVLLLRRLAAFAGAGAAAGVPASVPQDRSQAHWSPSPLGSDREHYKLLLRSDILLLRCISRHPTYAFALQVLVLLGKHCGCRCFDCRQKRLISSGTLFCLVQAFEYLSDRTSFSHGVSSTHELSRNHHGSQEHGSSVDIRSVLAIELNARTEACNPRTSTTSLQ